MCFLKFLFKITVVGCNNDHYSVSCLYLASVCSDQGSFQECIWDPHRLLILKWPESLDNIYCRLLLLAAVRPGAAAVRLRFTAFVFLASFAVVPCCRPQGGLSRKDHSATAATFLMLLLLLFFKAVVFFFYRVVFTCHLETETASFC